MVCLLPDVRRVGLLRLHPPPHVHLNWPLQRNQTAPATADPGGTLHTVQSCPHMGPGSPPGLSYTRPRHPRHQEHHADRRGLRDEQPTLPDLWVPACLLHPDGDHDPDLRPDSSPPQEAEVDHSQWRQASH